MRLIDADKLTEDFFELSKKYETENFHIDTIVDVVIGNSPTIAPDSLVKHGKWIPDDYGYYHCSECGYEQDERETVTPYCFCGAKMEVGGSDKT